jgi:hypothetical protein
MPASDGRMPTLAVERSHRTPKDEATSRMVLLSSERASGGSVSRAQRRSTPLLAAVHGPSGRADKRAPAASGNGRELG